MIENIIVYEDNISEGFAPLLHTRPVFELKVGMFSFLERIHLFFPKTKYCLWVRDYLRPAVSQRYPKYFINTPNVGLHALIINGRAVITQELVEMIEGLEEENYLVVKDGKVVLFYLSGELLAEFMKGVKQTNFSSEEIIRFLRKKSNLKIINYSDIEVFENIWSMVKDNGKILTADFVQLAMGGLLIGNIHPQAVITNGGDIYVGKNSKVGPFVHLDAANGPIYIGENVEIKSHVLIEGPVSVDDNCVIYPGLIRKNTTIGENCRVGGEVEGSIFLANSNKYHAGFVGHSYLGEWVNLGALTTTSDLKNNYGNVSLTVGNKRIDTQQQFLGSIIADHVKCGIGTLLNTGSIIGFGSNIVGAEEVFPKWIPAFSWGNISNLEKYEFSKFLLTVEKVYARRGKSLLMPEKSLLEYIYKLITK